MAESTSDSILSIDNLKHRNVSNVIIMKTNSVEAPDRAKRLAENDVDLVYCKASLHAPDSGHNPRW
jgi:hypothetical protein